LKGERLVNARNKRDDRTEKLIIAIVKLLQPVTDEDIYLEYNEVSEQEISLKKLKERLKKITQLEKIGETNIDYDAKEIWQVKEE
jgi:hypothetical protein